MLELDDKLANDALEGLVASNFCNYSLKVASHLNLSFCRTNKEVLLLAKHLESANPFSTGVLDPGNYPGPTAIFCLFWAFLCPLVSTLNHM